MILIAYILLTILAATTDALFFNGNKSASKLVEFIFQAGLIFIPLLYVKRINLEYIVYIGLMYAFIRWSLFDLTFNLIARLNPNYVGTTTPIYDKLMSQLKDWAFWWMRVFAMGVAFVLYFRKIKIYENYR